jgi:hypothetical protein
VATIAEVIKAQMGEQKFAQYFFSALNANLRAGALGSFFSAKRKRFRFGSAAKQAMDGQSNGVKPPKMFYIVTKITVRVFEWPLQRL